MIFALKVDIYDHRYKNGKKSNLAQGPISI